VTQQKNSSDALQKAVSIFHQRLKKAVPGRVAHRVATGPSTGRESVEYGEDRRIMQGAPKWAFVVISILLETF
jgi:hypothetical protein